MAGKLDIKTLGLGGVNVDKNPLELADDELTQAQNAIVDDTSGKATLRKRMGLVALNGSAAGASILGGTGVQLADKVTGTRLFFIGRGTI